LVDEDPKSAEILKPVLRGRDIERYHAKWMNLWLIATMPSQKINIDDYSAIKKYLLHYGKERLCQKSLRKNGKLISRKKSPHRWYELQDTCAYHDKFFENKIIYPRMNPKGIFAFDKNGMILNDSLIMLIGSKLHYLLGVLNSNLIGWYISKIAPTIGKGNIVGKVYLETIPIPIVSKKITTETNLLVEEALTITSHQSNWEIETQMNNLLFEFHGLSKKEIDIVNSDLVNL